MNRVVRKNITDLPYSLHDGVVIDFKVRDDTLQMQFQSGIIKTFEPFEQVDGSVEFEQTDWDSSYVYLLTYQKGLCGNPGNFTGKKMLLKEWIAQYQDITFEIIDENYGYNQSKFSGYLSGSTPFQECFIEIYHLGDMSYLISE